MTPFKLNNQIYDIPEELAEQFELDNPDAILVEDSGKKQPTPQQGAENVDVTEALDTDSRLGDFSLDLREENNLNEFLKKVEEAYKDDLNSGLDSFLKEQDAGFLTEDGKIHPGYNAVNSPIYKERLNNVNKKFNNLYNEIVQKEYKKIAEKKNKELETFDPTIGLTVGQNFMAGVAKTFESMLNVKSLFDIEKGPSLKAKEAFSNAKKLDIYSAAERDVEAREERIKQRAKDEGWSPERLQQQLSYYTDPTLSSGKKIADTKEEYIWYLNNKMSNLNIDVAKNIAESNKGFQDLVLKYGADPEFFDEGGSVNITFGKTARAVGNQATQAFFSLLTAPVAPGRATYLQEIGPMLTEALDVAAKKEYGPKFSELSKENQIDNYLELIEEGKLDLSKLETSAIFSGLLDTASTVFGAFKVAKAVPTNFFRNIFKRKLGKSLKMLYKEGKEISQATVLESFTELGQEALNVMGVEAATGIEQDFAAKRFKEVGLQTLLTTPFIIGGGRGIKTTGVEAKRMFEGAINPESLRAEINNQKKVINMLEENESISSEQAADAIDNLYATENVINSSAYKKFEPEAKADLVNIIAKEIATERKIESLKKTYTADNVFSAGELKALENSFNDIKEQKSEVERIQNYLVRKKTLAKHINNTPEKYNNYKVYSFKTNKDLFDFAKTNNIPDKDIAQIFSKEQPGFGQILDNKKIVLLSDENVKNAKGAGNQVVGSNVVHHELTHIIASTLSDKDLSDFVKNIKIKAKKLSQDSNFRKAYKIAEERVKKDYDEFSDRTKAEEFIASMSDFLRALEPDGILVDDATFLSEVFSGLAEKLNLATPDTMDFSGLSEPEQALQFFKKYNSFLGNSNTFFKGAGKLATSASKVNINGEEIVKLSKPLSGEAIQKIYEEQGVAGAMDIIDAYKPLTSKITKKYQNVPGYDFELLQSEIELGKRGLLDLIQAYTLDKGATLNTYVQGQLTRRAIEAASRILDTEFTEDITGAKSVTDTTTEEVIEKVEDKKPKEKVSLRKKLELDESIKPTVVAAIKKTFGTKLPSVSSPNFRSELQKSFRTELKKPLAKLMGRTEDYRSFLSNNFEAIYEAIPQYVINKRFNAFAEAAVDANGKPLREKTAEGKKIFTKKKIVKAEWLKYFLGDGVGRSTQGTRKTALAEALAEQFAYDATMEVLADPKVVEKIKGISELTGQKFVDNYLDEVSKAIERPTTFKFSLSTKIDSDWVADPLNPLSGDKKYNFTVGKATFESKIFDGPDFPYEIFEGTFGIEDGTLADDPKSVLLAFADKKTGSTGILGTATQGLTSAFQVFGTVANSTIDLVKKEKLNSVAFTAKENSRIRLYNALANKFAKELGWDYYNFEIEGETAFIAYDPKLVKDAEESNISKDIIKFSKSAVFNNDGNKVLFKDELGDIFKNVDGKIKLNKETKFTSFEKLFLNYSKNNFKRGDGAPYNAKRYRSVAWEYYAGRQIELSAPELKMINDFRGFSNKGIGDLEFLHEPSGKKIYVEVKLLNRRGRWPQMGSGGVGFDYDSNTFIEPEKGKPIQIWEYITAVLEKEGYNNKIKKVLDRLNVKKLTNLTPEQIKILDKYKKELNITIPLGNATNIVNTYAKEGVNLMVSGNDSSNMELHSLDNNNLGLDIPTLQGEGSFTVRVVYSNKSKGNASIRGINNIKNANKGLPVQKFKPVIKASKSLSREFNEVLEKSTGVEWYKTYSPVKARLVGKGKGRKFFIPYSADDFVGLLYTTLGKGKIGDQQMAWYEENLLRPFSRGIQRYEAAKQKALRDWMMLKKQVVKDVPGGLNKTNNSGFTNQTSVRVYIWNKQGMKIPDMSKKDLNENLKIIRNNPKLKEFADTLIALNPDGYPEPSNNWDSGDITTDLVSYINDVRRGEFLTEWKENAKEVFSENNKNKLRALYGDRYVEALNDMLHRMRTGRNRKIGTSKIERVFMDWTNNSVGAIMFFNARSAVLQTLSSVNFINFSDNNPINAGLAFANQKQYWKDFATLFNSDFLKQRRSGLQTDINADEIANAAATSENKAKAALSAILKFGFTPTQIADSFAIASGGATMYRNRIKKYLKGGLDQEAAEKRAFTDFQEIAEETQQSARPDRISMQQASSLGRLVLAFGNTPMQYARLTKKATLDLINGRGDWKTNISKIAYYSVIQNIIFSALQQGLFALLFDEEDDDKEKERYFRIANSSIDTLLRGTGVYGAAAATVKNMIMEIIEQSKKSRPDYTKVAIEATQISPPINSKLRKLESAGKTFTYKQSREKVFTEGFSLENPAFLAAGKIISAGTNLPADRVVQKADHIYTALQPETELWQSLALSLGWSEWDLGMIERQTKKESKRLRSRTRTRTRTRKKE